MNKLFLSLLISSFFIQSCSTRDLCHNYLQKTTDELYIESIGVNLDFAIVGNDSNLLKEKEAKLSYVNFSLICGDTTINGKASHENDFNFEFNKKVLEAVKPKDCKILPTNIKYGDNEFIIHNEKDFETTGLNDYMTIQIDTKKVKPRFVKKTGGFTKSRSFELDAKSGLENLTIFVEFKKL